MIRIATLQDSVYAGEVYTLQFRFPSNYPFESPEVMFIQGSPVHPHVREYGDDGDDDRFIAMDTSVCPYYMMIGHHPCLSHHCVFRYCRCCIHVRTNRGLQMTPRTLLAMSHRQRTLNGYSMMILFELDVLIERVDLVMKDVQLHCRYLDCTLPAMMMMMGMSMSKVYHQDSDHKQKYRYYCIILTHHITTLHQYTTLTITSQHLLHHHITISIIQRCSSLLI